ncbi:MAG: hypothetical protein ACK4K0_04370 [Flavobacteriales bacterium]
MRTTAKILLTFILLNAFHVFAQLPAVEQGEFLYKKADYASVFLHSDGWGVSCFKWKSKTYLKKTLYGVDILNMKHPKEVKSYNVFNESSRGYVYGKLNYFYIIRPQIGVRKVAYEKLRSSGVEISYVLTGGPSLGFARPVYLEILKFDQGINFSGVVEERYDPEAHNTFNIYGRARGGRGWGEVRIHPGAFVKAGLNFEYGYESDGIKSLELGATLDAYPTRVPMMAYNNDKIFFLSFYIGLQIGKKYF